MERNFSFNPFKKSESKGKKPIPPRDGEISLTRRQALAGAGALVVGGAVLGASMQSREGPFEHGPNNERMCEPGEMFERQQRAFMEVYGTLSANEIQFIDTYTAPIGGPYEVEAIGGVDPGAKNKSGIIANAIRHPWLVKAREDVLARHPEVKADISKDEPRQTNTIALLRMAKERNPDMKLGTLLDVIHYYGDIKVNNVDEDINRIEYVRKHIGNKVDIPVDPKHPNDSRRKLDLPDTVIKELKYIVPGQAAQESGYNNDLTSSKGAEGIFQFMPATWNYIWKRYGMEPQNPTYLKNQVDAATLYILDAHHELAIRCSEALATVQRNFFDGKEKDFQKYFVVQSPMLQNSE